MFTMAEIDALHDRLGNAETLVDYLRGLAAIGVVRFESCLVDGHSEFFALDGRRVVSPPHHEVLHVAEVSDRCALVEHLRTAPTRGPPTSRCPRLWQPAVLRSGWPTPPNSP